ncbi:hypothetical protein F2P56_000022 [Juglans regia]|uniref:Malectin-like domain-containing protein n=1 Tax=Juglans regia TaxID=51240 RepID=A0A833Y6F1_JUGRE|nr:hypothetical protein F2P56_000022 [Juglans regia]
MGPNKAINLLSNLTWGLPIASGFNYLVRLHFCELESLITKPGERSFTIYIDNQTAEVAADVIMWSKGRATPVFQDYVVKIENKGFEAKSTMFIALHLGKATNSINDVILNGVEGLKLSNIRTTLAKPLSTGTRHESKLKNTIIIVTGSCGGFLILLTLMWFMVLSKTRKTNSYGSYSYPLSKYCRCWPDPSKRKSTGTKAS